MTEWHLGHVPGTVIVDKTELDTLRTKVTDAQAGWQSAEDQISQDRRDIAGLAELLRAMRVERDRWKEQYDTLARAVSAMASQREQALKQCDLMRQVVEAARKFDLAQAEFGFEPAFVSAEWLPLHNALAAFDQQQEVPD